MCLRACQSGALRLGSVIGSVPVWTVGPERWSKPSPHWPPGVSPGPFVLGINSPSTLLAFAILFSDNSLLVRQYSGISLVATIAFIAPSNYTRTMTAATLPIPSPEEAAEAKLALRTLSPANRGRARTVRVRADGEDAIVPKEAFELLLEILGQMANGNAVTIVPVQAELTTQQAADFLNVSRPHLIELLEAGTIPYRKVGTHRRIRFEDLLGHKQADDLKRQAVLAQLAADAQAHGMGY